MKNLIAILTGLHVLAHGVFGCCDHEFAALARPTADTTDACVCHHAHHHAHVARAASDCNAMAQQQPAPAPHECVHAACHWMVDGAGPSIAPLDLCGLAHFVAVVPVSTSASLAAQYQPDDVRGRTSAPPLRLHLALGVLVV